MDLDHDYVFNIWGVFPAHRSGTSMDGTVRYYWRAEFCNVAMRSNGPFFATLEEAQREAERRTKDNVGF